MLQIFPEVNVAIDEARVLLQQLIERLSKLSCVDSFYEVRLHPCLEEKGIGTVDLLQLVDTGEVLGDRVLVVFLVSSATLAALHRFNHLISFLSAIE